MSERISHFASIASTLVVHKKRHIQRSRGNLYSAWSDQTPIRTYPVTSHAMNYTAQDPTTQQMISATIAATLGQVWTRVMSGVPERLRRPLELEQLDGLRRQVAVMSTEQGRAEALSKLSDATRADQQWVGEHLAAPYYVDLTNQVWLPHVARGLEVYMSTLRAITKISGDDLISHLKSTGRTDATTETGWANLRSKLLRANLPVVQGTLLEGEEAEELRTQLAKILQTGLLVANNERQICQESVLSMIYPLAAVSSAAESLSHSLEQAGPHSFASCATNAKGMETAAMDMITAIVGDALRWRASNPDPFGEQQPTLDLQALALMGLEEGCPTTFDGSWNDAFAGAASGNSDGNVRSTQL